MLRLHGSGTHCWCSAGRWMAFGALRRGTREVSVPAVSMARRRVDRLRAANIAAAPWKFARKLARPPDCVRNARQKMEAFVPDDSDFGRAGVTDEGCFPSNGLGLRRALPAPA